MPSVRRDGTSSHQRFFVFFFVFEMSYACAYLYDCLTGVNRA